MTSLRALVATLQDETGGHFLHPYDDDAMIAGHGSVGLEVLEDVPDADLIVVGIGGGGPTSGVAVAAAANRRGIQTGGGEPDSAPTMPAAMGGGKPGARTTIKTNPDGRAGPIAGTGGFDIVGRLVEDVVLVSEEEIKEGMRFLAERAKLVAEPAGAAATGALLAGKIKVRRGERVVSIVSGGNVDRAKLAELIAPAS